MTIIRILDRKEDHLCDWNLQHEGTNLPNIVRWKINNGDIVNEYRYFVLDPNSVTRQSVPLPPGATHAPITYRECDAPVTIGVL